MVMGVSGSGKSTVGAALAARLGFSFIEGDQFHPQNNVDKMAAGIALTDEDRVAWLAALRQEIVKTIKNGHCAAVSCSALKESYRTVLEIDQAVQFVFLNIPFAEAQKRLLARTGHFMPASLLESQFAALQEPCGASTINVDALQSPVQIVNEVVAKLQN